MVASSSSNDQKRTPMKQLGMPLPHHHRYVLKLRHPAHGERKVEVRAAGEDAAAHKACQRIAERTGTFPLLWEVVWCIRADRSLSTRRRERRIVREESTAVRWVQTPAGPPSTRLDRTTRWR
jgi:hypothetical protein